MERFDNNISVVKDYLVRRRQNFIFPVSTLFAVLIATDGKPELWPTLPVVIASYCMGLAIYVYNDIADADVDKANEIEQPMVKGTASKNFTLKFVAFLSAAALTLGVFINIPTLILGLISLAIGIGYSHPMTNFKDKVSTKTLATAGGGAMSPLVAGAAVENISLEIVSLSIIFFLLMVILALLGDVGDIKGDRSNRKMTLPIKIGVKPTLFIIYAMPILMIIQIALVKETIGMSWPGLAVVGAICALLFFIIYPVKKKWDVSSYVHKTRYKIRYASIILQIALVVAMVNVI